MSDDPTYLLGYRQAEQERLERQALELADESAWLFDQIGVREGWRALEVGCGPQGCLGLLAQRVGPTGRVLGLEVNAELAQRARAFAAQKGLAHVEVRHADARHAGLAAGSFDLATARLVLVNVPQPQELVAEMVRLVAPGGCVALHEADASLQRCEPPHPAQLRLLALLEQCAQMSGIDRAIGLQLPRMLREAGVVDVRVHPFMHAYPPLHARRLLLLEFVQNTRQRLLDLALVEEAELDALVAALRQHLEDPGTLVLSSLFLQVWGRVPAQTP